MLFAATALLFLSLGGAFPDWEIQLEATPRDGPHLVPDGAGGQCILIPMGNAGLGGWSHGGAVLQGFPVSSGAGVILRPAWIRGPGGSTLISYADNTGHAHLVDIRGAEVPGWPVNTGGNIVTGVSAVDLDCDENPEIAFGTSDGMVWLLDSGGDPLPGWPVDLSSQLLWQPTQVSLGGGSGKGLVCALSSSVLTVLDMRGEPLPGWPLNLPFPVGSNPVSGDLNCDGQADIVFASQNRRFYLLNSQGREQEGWPYFLSDRPVRGAAALGMLGSAFSSPQTALSTIDSLVYLLNGNGTLAGEWRWPNRTESIPFQPIVVNTPYGPAVLAATENGMIHAWNAAGESLDGFPFQHQGGVAFPPVAGDLDGNGFGELVVLSAGGGLAVYSLNAHYSEGAIWPLPLGNPANSGVFGCSDLPVATVGEVESRNTGDVVIPFSVSGSPYSDITLYYSLDAGYSWLDTRSFTRNQSSIVWHTDADLPHGNERQVVVRVTPVFQGGLGECGISGIFQVDNNIPPAIHLETPEMIGGGRVSFTYTVDDPEGDIIQIQAQYSTDGGENWHTMHLGGTTLEISPWFYGEPFHWNAERDLGQLVTEDVHIRVRAADAKPGPWDGIEGLTVDTRAILPDPEAAAPGLP